jgi:uncharacterized membrane protein YbjE (DUF340 family)
MTYITREGDTLQSIAASRTLSPSYGEAIARANALTNDFMTTPVNVPLEPGLALDIPDTWLKPGGASIMDQWAGLPPLQRAGAAVVILVLARWLTRERRKH